MPSNMKLQQRGISGCGREAMDGMEWVVDVEPLRIYIYVYLCSNCAFSMQLKNQQ